MAVYSGHTGLAAWTGFLNTTTVLGRWTADITHNQLEYFKLDGSSRSRQAIHTTYQGGGSFEGVMDGSGIMLLLSALIAGTAAALLTLTMTTSRTISGSAELTGVSPTISASGEQAFTASFIFAGDITIA